LRKLKPNKYIMKKYFKIFVLFLTVTIASESFVNAQEVVVRKHRKWSNRAKGAAIGGGAGAVAGALIGHGVKGALIGGAIGAGGGYIIGDAKDRKQLRAREAYARAHPRHAKSVTTTTTVKTTHY
jgi:uncharacterized protein YcfJ